VRQEEASRTRSYRIDIEELLPADSPRISGVNEAHIRALAQIEGDLPAILVHKHTMRVIDGMHRLDAAKLRGQREISVEFFDGTEEAAFLRAVEANIAHGLPLSLEDRRAAAARIITTMPQMSDRAIAERTGLASMTVASVRRQTTADQSRSEVRIGGDGRRRPVNGADGRRRAAEAITANPSAPLRKIAEIAGVSLGTAHTVKTKLRRSQNHVDLERGKVAPERTEVRPGANEGGRKWKPKQNNRDRLLSMQRDPILRFSELGKELLRLLHTQDVAEPKIAKMVDVVPAYLTPIVAEMALQYSATWHEFANKLRERSRQYTDAKHR
jgi:hypothetical protein